MDLNADEIVKDPHLLRLLESNRRVRDQCLSIADLLEQHKSMPANAPLEVKVEHSKRQKSVISNLAIMRGLNRQALYNVRDTKSLTAEARKEIDELHLKLQNLYYEQRHLLGEIEACESYAHKYQQLPLIPAEDFLELRPEHKDDDESTLMMARIMHEHDERQKLEDERQVLLKKKQALVAENNKRKEDLANLDKDLEKFIDAAQPIQKILEKEY